MVSASTTAATQPTTAPLRQVHRRTAVVLILVAAAICAIAVTWRHWWPFEEPSVIKNLQEVSDSQVRAESFQKTYFPPGCVMTGVQFLHGSISKPLITIEKLTVRGSYPGILAHYIPRITAEGTHVFIPPIGTGQTFHTTPSTLTIGEIVANGATLEIASQKSGEKPLRFEIHESSFGDVAPKRAMTYRISVHNPNPPGEITASGKFGAWVKNNAAQTPLSGEYKFEHADLGVYHGIAGMLSSTGKFDGTLGHINIAGNTDTPDFEVTMSGHRVRLITEFNAYVDATKGDTFLQRVDARFRKTRVIAEGSIAKSENGRGKTALIHLSTRNGRIEDILGLFVKKQPPPMSGAVTLRAKVEVPPGDQPFLEKIRLKGKFGIEAGEFSNSTTQEGVDKLSAGARGEKDTPDPATVLTDLLGRVTLSDGVATFSDLSFGVPGASAHLNGTYNIINHKIDLRGQMQVDTKISNTTSGAKSFLLKVMDPFFRKRKKGEILPVRISGTYENPSFGLDLRDKKAQQVAPPSSTRR